MVQKKEIMSTPITADCGFSLKQFEDEMKKKGFKGIAEGSRESAKMMYHFGEHFFSQLKKYSEKLGLDMWLVIQNTMLRRFADDRAFDSVYGTPPVDLPEYVQTLNGVLTDKELEDYLFEDFRFRYENEYATQLEKNELAGAPLTDEEYSIMIRHGKGVGCNLAIQAMREAAKKRREEAKK